MRIIITGGSGMIGRALTERLAGTNHEVVILSRSPEQVEGLPPNARAVKWDARSAAGWDELAEGAGAIVNLAGESLAGDSFFPDRWTAEKRRRILESRRNAGRAVIEAVERAEKKPGMVFQVSAIGYYGVHGDEELDESSAPGDDFLANVCQEWEASTAAVEAHGVRRVIGRYGLVLTPEGGALRRVLVRYQLFGGGPFGSGRQWWSWVHQDDVIVATHFLIEMEAARGPFNVTAPNPVTNDEFGKTLGRVIRRPHFFPLPAFVMRALFGEVATVVVDGQRVLPRKLQEMQYPFLYPELEPALCDLMDVEPQE